MAKKHRTSTNSDRHPYLRVKFWRENPFWNTGMYSPKSKDYFNDLVESWSERERNYISL